MSSIAQTANPAALAGLPPPATECGQAYRHFWLTRLSPLFCALALIVLLGRADMVELMLACQRGTQALPDTWWSMATLLGHGSVLFGLTVIIWRQRPDWIIACLCATPVAALLSRCLKNWMGGPRPAAIIPAEQLHVVGERLLSGAFPSGHTCTAFVLTGVILLAGRVPLRLAWLALLLALFAGLSRIAVGAHWPIDVIAGAGCGWFSAACGVAMVRHFPQLLSARAQFLAALIVALSSVSLFFVNAGYPLAVPLQFLSAGIGLYMSLRWAQQAWQPSY